MPHHYPCLGVLVLVLGVLVVVVGALQMNSRRRTKGGGRVPERPGNVTGDVEQVSADGGEAGGEALRDGHERGDGGHEAAACNLVR